MRFDVAREMGIEECRRAELLRRFPGSLVEGELVTLRLRPPELGAAGVPGIPEAVDLDVTPVDIYEKDGWHLVSVVYKAPDELGQEQTCGMETVFDPKGFLQLLGNSLPDETRKMYLLQGMIEKHESGEADDESGGYFVGSEEELLGSFNPDEEFKNLTSS